MAEKDIVMNTMEELKEELLRTIECYYIEMCIRDRLACVRHAASVHPEPGSNSQIKS